MHRSLLQSYTSALFSERFDGHEGKEEEKEHVKVSLKRFWWPRDTLHSMESSIWFEILFFLLFFFFFTVQWIIIIFLLLLDRREKLQQRKLKSKHLRERERERDWWWRAKSIWQFIIITLIIIHPKNIYNFQLFFFQMGTPNELYHKYNDSQNEK